MASSLEESPECRELRYQEMPNFNLTYTGPAGRPEGEFADLVLFWATLAGCILALIAFPLVKHVLVPRTSPYHRYMAVRDYPPIVVMLFGNIMLAAGSCLFVALSFGQFPCWLSYLIIIFPPMIALPVALRLFSFYRNLKLSEASSSTARGLIDQRTSATPTIKGNKNEVDDETSHSEHKLRITFSTLIRALLLPVLPGRWFPDSMLRDRDHQYGGGTKEAQLSLRKAAEMIASLRALSTKRGNAVMLIVMFTPFVVVQIGLLASAKMVQNNCYTCLFSDLRVLQVSMYTVSLISILILAYSLWLLRKAEDPLLFLFEIKIAVFVFAFPATVVFIASGFAFRTGNFSLRFIFIPVLFFTSMSQSLAPALLVLYWHVRHIRREGQQGGSNRTGESQLSGHVLPEPPGGFRNAGPLDPYSISTDNLVRVLESRELRKAFEDHLTAEHGVESLLFLDEVKKWQGSFHDLNPQTRFVRAKKIVAVFIGDDAVFPVNISYGTMSDLRSKVGLKSENSQSSFRTPKATVARASDGNETGIGPVKAAPGFVDENVFASAEDEIMDLMRKDSFVRFMRTKRYKELVDSAGLAIPPAE